MQNQTIEIREYPIRRPRQVDLRDESFASQTLRPFLRYFAEFPAASQILAPLASLAPEGRVPANDVRELILKATLVTGEWGIGLKVGRSMSRGEAGAIDYVTSSAATLAEAISVMARNFRLVNDALSVSVLRNDEYALVRFDSRMPWENILGDYLLSAIFTNHLRDQLDDPSRLEVWFGHAAPYYQGEYVRTFAPAEVRFEAPCYGFRVPTRELDRPLRSADPYLHEVLQKHVAQLLIELPSCSSFDGRVTQVLTELLEQSKPPTARQVAGVLEISTRTLARRLEAEGTTFYEVLDRLRQRLAVDYVRCTKLAQCDVSARLGFAHAAAFHRAFKRWTGTTPAMLRKAHEARQT